jgi:hypothetical protein
MNRAISFAELGEHLEAQRQKQAKSLELRNCFPEEEYWSGVVPVLKSMYIFFVLLSISSNSNGTRQEEPQLSYSSNFALERSSGAWSDDVDEG